METTEKQFDAVKMMREIRDDLSQKFKDMNFEEQKEYIREHISPPVSREVERTRQTA